MHEVPGADINGQRISFNPQGHTFAPPYRAPEAERVTHNPDQPCVVEKIVTQHPTLARLWGLEGSKCSYGQLPGKEFNSTQQFSHAFVHRDTVTPCCTAHRDLLEREFGMNLGNLGLADIIHSLASDASPHETRTQVTINRAREGMLTAQEKKWLNAQGQRGPQ